MIFINQTVLRVLNLKKTDFMRTHTSRWIYFDANVGSPLEELLGMQNGVESTFPVRSVDNPFHYPTSYFH